MSDKPKKGAEHDSPERLFRPSDDDEVIYTKLALPPLTRMVYRTRLVDRLSRNRRRRLMIVSGPAGSGKTSLVRQWLARETPAAAWYSLDEADNHFDSFLRYFFSSLSVAHTGLKNELDPMLRDLAILSNQAIVSRLVRIFLCLDASFFIVLDDYHHITDIKIHDLIYRLISHIGPKVHFVLISRQNIPFSISHFKVRDQIAEITAENLKFSEKETQLFFDSILSMPISLAETRQLSRCMEGWIGGIQLVGLSIRGGQGNQSFESALTSACRQSTNYLMDQVLESLPEPVNQFISATALLDRFNPDLAGHVLGTDDTADLFEYALNNNLFLSPLDKQGRWFRFQHLLSEAVRQKIRQSNPDLWRRTYRRASLWFAQNGYFEDAFRHAFASEDMDFAADLLEEYLLHIYDRCEYASGMRWLVKLPHDILVRRPLLRLHEIGQKIESLRFTDIEAVLHDIKAHETSVLAQYQGHKRRLCADLLTYFSVMMSHYYKAPLDADLQAMEAAVDDISSDNKILSAHIKIHKALSCMLKAEPLSAVKELREASVIIFSSDTLWPRMIWSRTMATVERMQGRLLRSDLLLQEIMHFLSERNLSNPALKYMLYLPMAWNFYYRNDLDQAFTFADAAMKYAEKAQFSRDIVESALLLALISQAKGKHDEAEILKRKMIKIANQIDVTFISADPGLWIARLSMFQGDIQGGQSWSDRRRLSINDSFSIRFINECLAQAELFSHLKRYEKVIGLLQTLRPMCAGRNMMEKVLEMDLLHGAALYAADQQESGLALVKEALSFAAAEPYIRPFANYAGFLFPVLSRIKATASHCGPDSHLDAIWSACGYAEDENGSQKSAAHASGFLLTVRETEILQMMAVGYRYREIAEKAFISIETVKTHAKHIYEKLNVNSRVQAIRKGRQLGILDNH